MAWGSMGRGLGWRFDGLENGREGRGMGSFGGVVNVARLWLCEVNTNYVHTFLHT